MTMRLRSSRRPKPLPKPSRKGAGHQKKGSEGPYFQGNFQKLKTSKGVKFPKDVPKPFCLRQIVSDEKKE